MSVLLIANREDPEGGFVEEALASRGLAVRRAWRGEALPALDDDLAAVVALGSEWSVYWDEVADAVAAEAALLRQATASGVAVLGICFGAQLLAHALGGSVERAPAPELGWLLVDTDVADVIPSGPWVQWHADRFTVPPGARELARSAAGPQAFVAGSAVGVQFHPETTPATLDRWLGSMAPLVQTAGADPEQLRAQSARYGEQARQRADDLVGALLGGRFAALA